MKVTFLTTNDVIWPMGSPDSQPYYQCGMGEYPRISKIDPYPAYAHNLELVESLAAQCEAAFPMPEARIGLWLFSHDFSEHWNGVTYEDCIYKRDDGSEWEEEIMCACGCGKMKKVYGQALTIALAGKRTPIMAPMTRYLVPHEYGHAVFDYIDRKMGYDRERNELEIKYMEMRGIEDYEIKYRGGQWHRAPSEIIANDFRILFTKQELEFYPHDCPLPSWRDAVGNWWLEALKTCKLDKQAAAVEGFIHGKKKRAIV